MMVLSHLKAASNATSRCQSTIIPQHHFISMSLQAEKALPPIPPPTPLPIRPYSPVTVVTFEPDEFEEIHVQPAPVATAATPAFSLPGAERLSGFFTTASSHIESLIGAIASRSSMILKGWEFQISVDAFNVPGLMEMSAKDPVLRAGVTALEEIFMATLLLKYHKAKCELLASCSARVLFAIRDLWSTTWEKERLRLATRGYAL
ncbi:hypothetical protein BOTBODRAFT_352403 [Botryobasidium botryosum FD-172 SS1]|uniref:Uncharacterized protein n=1 Tax=Botryobasidium botryosum (strain FD-172 SS1) TaxID=930990 RepID=A0A067MF28_BOTB1|nr:hypothetical protein BOTBODRAFT_352403 [Botryobasidium botryosum FD-172 SS1]